MVTSHEGGWALLWDVVGEVCSGQDGQQLEMVFRASWEDEAACRSVGLAKRYEQSVVRTQKPP